MIKLVILCSVFTAALAVPAADPVSGIKTPASTSKLTPIVTPIVHIPYVAAPVVPQVSPYAYSYSVPIDPVAYAPGSYSIEQHGYNIAY